MSKYVQLSLFGLETPEAPAATSEPRFVDEAAAFLQASDTVVPVPNEHLIEMLTPGREVEFVMAAEATMKQFWRTATKRDKTPKQAFFHLFLQLGSQQNVSRARYLMHYGVRRAFLGDFYDAGYEAIALLPSMPVKEAMPAAGCAYAENLPTTSDGSQSLLRLNPEALQKRFDQLFAIRQTTAEFIYLRMLLEAQDAEAMYKALQGIAVGVDTFAGAKPSKTSSLRRAWATLNKEHVLAQAYINGVLRDFG